MRAFIIAEAGVNHNGKLALAKKLADAAKEAGADCVKFQTFRAERLVTEDALPAEYQKQRIKNAATQREMLKKLELSYEAFEELKAYCEERKMEFLSTAFDPESADFLNGLGMKRFKIPSGEITNLPLLMKIAGFHKPTLLSTGVSTSKECEEALAVLRKYGAGDITVLHCATQYPAPYEEVNLRAMVSMREQFQVKTGFSDHTAGIAAAIAAAALGAAAIEKHLTLDRRLEGPDHKASLEPREFKAMAEGIRQAEAALGGGEKRPSPCELQNREIVRKSIRAKRNISKGEILTEENLTVKRPGDGLSPMRWFDALGKKAVRDFQKDENITL